MYKNDANHLYTSLTHLYANKKGKYHLFDRDSSIGIIDVAMQQAWANPKRNKKNTDVYFNAEFAKIEHFIDVNRNETLILDDWLWNIFWYSPEITTQLCKDDEYYKINSWIKPTDLTQKKLIFQLSSYFIQGSQIKTVASHLQIPIYDVKKFIGSHLIIQNAEKIHKRDAKFKFNQDIKNENVIKSFFSNLRKKLKF